MSRRQPKSGMRLLAWSGLVALALALAAASALPSDAAVASAAVAAVSLIPIALASAGSVVTFWRVEGEERRFWMYMGVATSLLAASETFWAYWIVFIDPTGPVLPHPFELLQLGAAVTFVAAIMSLSRFGSEPLAVRLRYHLDTVLAMLLVFFASYRWLIGPLFAEIPGRSTGLLLVGSAYPVIGTTLLVGTFGIVVGLKAGRWRTWERLFALSLSVYSFGILAWPWWYLELQRSGGQVPPSFLVDYPFPAGFYLLFVAAVYRLTEGEGAAVPRSVRVPIGRWPTWLVPVYFAGVALCVPALAWASATATDAADEHVYMAGAVTLVFLLGARSWLSMLEGSHLRVSSMTDPVTGVGNRRGFDAALSLQVPSGSRTGSVIALDIDGFGRINEVSGRAEGDRILRDTAAILASVTGPDAALFRLGEDDLMMLLPGVGPVQAAATAAACATRVEDSVRWGAMAVSISAGVASWPTHGRTGEVIVRNALNAREWARAAGGARMRVYEEAEGRVIDPLERLERIKRGDQLSMIRALASAVDARDPHAADHSRLVAGAAVALAREIGFPAERVALVETAALAHDIGKLAVDDRVLKTPDLLTQDERASIEEHPVLGEQVLRFAGIPEVLPWVRHHHERWDGGGYPDGLAGDAIPLEARIIAIADAYEVMTSGRPYQAKLDHRAALRHIELEAGTHFDPSLASVFVKRMWDAEPLTSVGPA